MGIVDLERAQPGLCTVALGQSLQSLGRKRRADKSDNKRENPGNRGAGGGRGGRIGGANYYQGGQNERVFHLQKMMLSSRVKYKQGSNHHNWKAGVVTHLGKSFTGSRGENGTWEV